jgi:hypothetical protein
MSNKLELSVSHDGNGYIGNFWRISAWRGDIYLGEGIYSGYTRREAMRLARESVKDRGGLGIWAR